MTTANAVERPSYLQLPPGAVCAGCGKHARAEGQPDLQQAERYVCILCTEKGITSTPAEVGATAGRAIGRMFFATKDLVVELLEAIEHVKKAGPEAAAALAATLAAPAPPEDNPLGLLHPMLNVAHADGLVDLAEELRYQIDQLESEPKPDRPDQLSARRSARRLQRW